MAWITGERPGVFVDHDGSAVVGGQGSGGSAALIAKLPSYEKVKTFYSVGGLSLDSEVAGNADVLAQAKYLLDGNFSAVHILPVSGTLVSYVVAFGLLDDLAGLNMIVCDSSDATVQQYFADHLESRAENQREYLGFCAAASTGAAKSVATTLNCMRLVMVGQGGAKAAAALAAAVSKCEMTDPLYDLDLAEGVDAGSRLSEDEISELIRSGVTPLEQVGGRVYSIRTVTTRSQIDGVFDRTLLDLQVVRIVDHVLSNVRLTLRRMLGKVRSNAQSRLAIATQTRLVMEEMVAAGLIAQYDPPVIETDSGDSTVCNVLLSFAVARGYARIVISATVSV